MLLLLSHSVVSDSVQPHRRQPTRLPRPWDSPGKNTGEGCHFLLQCMKVKSLSRARLLATPWTAAHQAPLSMGFSRQEYWSELPLPSIYSPVEFRIFLGNGSASRLQLVRISQRLAWERVGTMEPSGVGLHTSQSLLPDPAWACGSREKG